MTTPDMDRQFAESEAPSPRVEARVVAYDPAAGKTLVVTRVDGAGPASVRLAEVCIREWLKDTDTRFLALSHDTLAEMIGEIDRLRCRVEAGQA